jgi:AraC-like DNA-binding protein
MKNGKSATLAGVNMIPKESSPFDLSLPELKDVTITGPGFKTWGVRSGTEDPRSWLEGFSVCPALAMHQIIHVGRASSAAPHGILRTRQTSSFFLACMSGEGRVLVDGRWLPCRPGMAMLLPPHTLEAYYALPGKRWEYCWVCYLQPVGQIPLATASSPVLRNFDPTPLQHAVEGLRSACLAALPPALLDGWVNLVHAHVMTFVRPLRANESLWHLWEKVAAHPEEDWSLERLARESHHSREQLRRLCQRELGRSPHNQVIYLRMKRAAELLATTDEKVDSVAHEVGYENPFVFSTTFKRWVGWSPSDYRARRTGQMG